MCRVQQFQRDWGNFAPCFASQNPALLHSTLLCFTSLRFASMYQRLPKVNVTSQIYKYIRQMVTHGYHELLNLKLIGWKGFIVRVGCQKTDPADVAEKIKPV